MGNGGLLTGPPGFGVQKSCTGVTPQRGYEDIRSGIAQKLRDRVEAVRVVGKTVQQHHRPPHGVPAAPDLDVEYSRSHGCWSVRHCASLRIALLPRRLECCA